MQYFLLLENNRKGIICNMCNYYKVGEVSKIFRVNPVTVRRWCKSGKIKAKKVGKSWYIHRDEVILFEDVRKKTSLIDEKT